MKKRILSIILLMIVSFMVYIPKTEAVVMWMQCTDNVDDAFGGEGTGDSYQYYSTFAVINGINSKTRHIVYDTKNGFYSSKMPTYVLYFRGKDGTQNGNICWYSDDYSSSNDINECDEENYFIEESELLNGSCPTKIYDVPRGFLGIGSDTAGAIQKDMLVLQGQKKAKNFETLDNSILVIYGFQEKSNPNSKGVIVESYYADGRYSFATDWEDFDKFTELLNMEQNNDANDLISEDGYSKEYMNWTMQSQARRIGYIGRDYFKLLEKNGSWLVGGREDQKLEVSDLDGNIAVYKSDDTENEGFGLWAKEWYETYATQLEKQLSILEKFEANGEYNKLINVSEEISEKVNQGKKYTFNESEYSAEKMVEELNKAYADLSDMLNSEKMTYKSYDKNCNVDDEETHDPLAAALTAFNCEVFGTNEVNNLPTKKNADLIDLIITETLSKNINKIQGSDIGLEKMREKSKHYAKLLAKSSNYINKNVFFNNEETKNLIDNLSTDYQSLVNEFGIQIVLDCESLIGKELLDEINSYLNIIKIAIPIILIGVGIIDFTKAMFSSSEDQMKKAQKDFITRLGIAMLIFLVPTIINILLSIANKVWNFIEPGSCGLFEM